MEETNKLHEIGPYIITKYLGSGAFSKVFKGYHRGTKQEVAIKSIKRDKIEKDERLLKNVQREISIMKTLDHPSLIKLIEVQETKKHIYLILEFCNSGDIYQFIKNTPSYKNNGLPLELVREFGFQIAAGLKYLVSKQLIHRDIKPHNILLHLNGDSIKEMKVKLADFGFARLLQEEELAQSLMFSPLYAAPELLQGKQYDHKIDIWSFGVLLYHMATGKHPFMGTSILSIRDTILKQADTTSFLSTIIDQSLFNLLSSLLHVDPCKRSTWDQILLHPFFISSSSSSLFTYKERREAWLEFYFLATYSREYQFWIGLIVLYLWKQETESTNPTFIQFSQEFKTSFSLQLEDSLIIPNVFFYLFPYLIPLLRDICKQNLSTSSSTAKCSFLHIQIIVTDLLEYLLLLEKGEDKKKIQEWILYCTTFLTHLQIYNK